MTANVFGLVAVGVYSTTTEFSTKAEWEYTAQLKHFCPYCYKPLLAVVRFNLRGIKFVKWKK